ncbi:MAG: hypothetical protein H7345_19015 [Rubritepida sp.]|nr:hypothetical protein [Rubritepida sp.]
MTVMVPRSDLSPAGAEGAAAVGAGASRAGAAQVETLPAQAAGPVEEQLQQSVAALDQFEAALGQMVDLLA